MKTQIINSINSWLNNNPNNNNDEILSYKIAFLKYMINNAFGANNAKSLSEVKDAIGYKGPTNNFQQQIVLPFKRESTFFIGSSNKGIFIVSSKEDAEIVVDFYQKRIDSETNQLNNLKNVMNYYGITI